MEKLNLNTFNDILFSAFKDKSPESKLELLEKELGLIANLFYSKMAEMFDELEKNGYESDLFNEIKAIKANTEPLLEEVEELKKRIGEK